jgi:hypothetical protein
MKKNLNFLSIILILCLLAGFVSCSSEQEEPTKSSVVVKTEQGVKSPSKSNGRVAYSSTAVMEYFVGMGFIVDSLDEEHYELYMGGTYELTIHLRGDTTYDDKFKITYESVGHSGEEVLFNGYLPNPSVAQSVVTALHFDGLQ